VKDRPQQKYGSIKNKTCCKCMKFIFLPAMMNRSNGMLIKHAGSSVNASNFNSGEPDLNRG
jgi:hypothetical protein